MDLEKRRKKKARLKNDICSFFIKVIILIIAVWAVFTFMLDIWQMRGETMYPRIRDGDLVLSYRLQKDYDAGDVITFNVDGNRRAARIAAKEGDVVGLSEDGRLTVNGNTQDEEVFYETKAIPGGITYPYMVDKDSYFVLCDFRTESSDSRDYGSVKKSDIVGKVITILRRRGI